VFTLGGGAIAWRSAKQTIIARSMLALWQVYQIARSNNLSIS